MTRVHLGEANSGSNSFLVLASLDQAAMDALPEAVYLCAGDGRVVRFNQKAVELWGRTPKSGDPEERFCGSFRLYRTDGALLPHGQCLMAAALQTGECFHNQEVVIEQPSGQRLTVLVNIAALKDKDGRVNGAINCLKDITDRKRAEAALQDSERRFREMIDSLPAAIYTTDAEGRITHFNPAAVAFAGRAPELGTDEWCVTWKLYYPDRTPMPHDQCPMAIALKEGRAVRGAEAIAERPDGTRVWFTPYPTPLRDDSGRIVGAINMLVDITERRQAEERQRLLVNELNHRVNNTLASVQAIVQHTLRTTKDPAVFVDTFAGRIQSLARVHSLLTATTWRGADLRDLIHDQLLQGAVDETRITAWGPPVRLEAQMTLHLALVLHELGTNAHKHGALSATAGWVTIGWTVEGHWLRLRWEERGGPPVTSPARRGFGTTLIEQSVKSEGGNARMSVVSDALLWEIALPLPAKIATDAIASRARDMVSSVSPPRRADLAAKPPGKLAGQRFLVVEDEPLVSLDIVAGLEETGAEVVASTGSAREALDLIESEMLDAALLDASLHGSPADEIAAALTRRKVPFLFVTGYGRESLPQAFRNVAVLSKPFSPQQLIEAAARLVERRTDVVRLRGN